MGQEQSGLEVLGCFFGLLALLFGGVSAAIIRLVLWRRRGPERQRHQRLDTLLMEFCHGADQSLAKVNQIRAVLMVTFADSSEQEELATVVNSFAPGGLPPFHDEAWLEERFRVYLRQRGITIPDYGKEQPGVWPPPPNIRS